jgi:nitrogen-specific signal transduction histidine kinase
MQIYSKKRWWKILLIFGAALISIASLVYTNRLVTELKEEEQKKIELWAEANRQLVLDDSTGETMALILEILRNNTTVPVILTDDSSQILLHRNIELPKKKQEAYLQKELEKMKRVKSPIQVELDEGEYQYIYYNDSILLIQLQWFPIVQLLVVFIFMLVSYVAFSATRQWEQDQVWVGMARETAHQLGTPTTSLLGWMDVLQMKQADPELMNEMKYDIQRLQTITSRFSKIGSKPDLPPEDVEAVINGMVSYLRRRSSSLVSFQVKTSLLIHPVIPLSKPLFEWVIENLCKNAIDAMEGEGAIVIKLHQQKRQIVIDVSDTGKGMTRAVQKTVFKPGYSTKVRGWGLGLTLSKRIVEHYHRGRISVLSSAPGKGCVFRIVLPTLDK